MAIEKWNEEGRSWEDDHTLLTDSEASALSRANDSRQFPSPIPTQMVSNGEYMPAPQTEKQKRVEARIDELSRMASRKLGIDRRRFLAGTGGMAASLLAMNEVFGRFFNVNPIEMLEPEAFAQATAPRDLFVFDDQLHMVRGKIPGNGSPQSRNPGGPLRALAQGPTSPGFRTNPNNPNRPKPH